MLFLKEINLSWEEKLWTLKPGENIALLSDRIIFAQILLGVT